MATVPVVNNFRTSVGGSDAMVRGPQGPTAGSIAGEQIQREGQAVQQLGAGVNRLKQEIDRFRVQDLDTQAEQAGVSLMMDKDSGFLNLRGRAAVERPDGKSLVQEVTDSYTQQLKGLEDTLGNEEQKSLFRQVAAQRVARMGARAAQHVAQEYNVLQVESAEGGISTAANKMALLYGDANEVASGQQAIRGFVDQIAKVKGWDENAKTAYLQNQLGAAHAGVMNSMIQAGRASDAKTYYDAHSAEMSVQARANMQGVIKGANDAQQANAGAEQIWSEIGPKSANEPVSIFDMERRARELFANSPDQAKLAIQGIRERAGAFNAQQNEQNAAGVNKIYGMIDGGRPLSTIQASAEWQALPEVKRHEILRGLEAEAAARESRAAAAEQRAYTREQRRQAMLLQTNGADYLRDSDPEILGQMSRTEVVALRTKYGNEGAQHLLTKWDALRKGEGKLEAKIDKEDFEHVADSLGLKPYETKKSEDDRRSLGELKFRVEKMIDAAQGQAKRTLSRDEKMKLMREEMARTVTIDPGFFSSNKQVPVISLTPEQVSKIVVPPAERSGLVELLRRGYASDPRPEYEPTEENIRRLWAAKTSSGAAQYIGKSK